MFAFRTITIAGWLALSAAVALAEDWTHLAADPARSATRCESPRSVVGTRWVAPPESNEVFISLATPIRLGPRVFVPARAYSGSTHVANRLIAFDSETGDRLWSAPLPKDVLDSWSSPAADATRQTVIVAAADRLFALHVEDGAVAWETVLPRPVVNASPLVTDDLHAGGIPCNRALIADYDAFGGSGALHAINVDAFHSTQNPHQPGAIVWSLPMTGSSGNSAAVADGVAYVAGVDGTIRAVDAASGAPLWETTIDLSGFPPLMGFYGGLTVHGGALFVAAYEFYGNDNSSLLCKLDAATGALIWSIPCERTQSIPIVWGGKRILLAGGISGFGSTPRLQAFLDADTHATPLWDTAADSGGALLVGGWTHQPVAGRTGVFVGQPPTGIFFSAYVSLMLIDPDRSPADPLFVQSVNADAGGSPAVASRDIWSIGTGGLAAIRSAPPCPGDVDGDGAVGQSDLAALLAAYGATAGQPAYRSDADLNCDGVVDQADLAALLAAYGADCD